MAAVPYPLAMVICDPVWKDPSTGKCTTLGTFSSIMAQTFPALHPQLTAYTSLTDGRGVVPIKLKLVDAEESREPLFEGEAEIEFADPRSVGELIFALQGITFPEPGEYRFQLFGAGEFIIERRILLIQTEAEGNDRAREEHDDE